MDQPVSKVRMFAGKGGVGKTTCTAATALHFASSGKKTLAISTDATPSLSHVFEIPGQTQPKRVSEYLHIHELGDAEVREMWNKKFGREVYEVFSSFVSISYAEFTEFMTSLLPGLAEEFIVDYIRELARNGSYECIVWDTAPLGQTLALLQTPAMLARHLRLAPRIYSRLKMGQKSREPILDIIKRWENLSADNINFLRNDVGFTLVTIPEALAVEQLDGIFRELSGNELEVTQIIVNNVINSDNSDFLRMKAAQQRGYLDIISSKYGRLPITRLPLFPYELKGQARLKEAEALLFK